MNRLKETETVCSFIKRSKISADVYFIRHRRATCVCDIVFLFTYINSYYMFITFSTADEL